MSLVSQRSLFKLRMMQIYMHANTNITIAIRECKLEKVHSPDLRALRRNFQAEKTSILTQYKDNNEAMDIKEPFLHARRRTLAAVSPGSCHEICTLF